MLNTTVLVAARSSVTVPVSCVEQGRWAWRGRRFASGQASLFASLRRKKAARVSAALRQGRGHASDQHEVWADIASRVAEHEIESPTGEMHAVYARFAGDLDQAREALAPRPRQAGAVVFLAGQWIGLDLLASSGLFARSWPRLCAGYAADAIGVAPADDFPVWPQEVLDAVRQAPLELAPAVGLGTEYRLGGAVAGAALVHEDRLAHLMAFPAPQGRCPARSG